MRFISKIATVLILVTSVLSYSIAAHAAGCHELSLDEVIQRNADADYCVFATWHNIKSDAPVYTVMGFRPGPSFEVNASGWVSVSGWEGDDHWWCECIENYGCDIRSLDDPNTPNSGDVHWDDDGDCVWRNMYDSQQNPPVINPPDEWTCEPMGMSCEWGG